MPSEILADGARFQASIAGYAPRQAQLEMADRIAQVIDQGGTFVCEAGTGIGKTLAYLIPVMLSARRSIVSTGTKTLQDQLFHRDVPVARAATDSSARVALLKGRSNYLCRYRLAQARRDLATSLAEAHDLERIETWSGHTQAGDVSELKGIPESASVWPRVTSSVDNCLGTQCPDFDACFVVKARRAAAGADVVIVNHHLLLSELVLREDGFGEVLPRADVVVCDEAHQLPDIAGSFFGSSISARQIVELCRDARLANGTEAGDVAELPEALAALESAARGFRQALGSQPERGFWDTVRTQPGVTEAREALAETLARATGILERLAERGPGLSQCALRAKRFAQRLEAFEGSSVPEIIRWLETSRTGVTLRLSPIDAGESFNDGRGELAPTWLFTSATLAVGDDMVYFCRRLGLDPDKVSGGQWASPFDYARQALCYYPPIGVEPAHPQYLDQVLAAAVPVIRAARGRCFFLFTSHRALTQAAEHLPTLLPEHFTFLKQGDSPKSDLLDRFRSTPFAVLLGTASFWEGVDVRGEALSCVIIDKLPFASPDDPLTRARLQALEANGANAFADYQLPEAVLALKQGAGRLIRDTTDRGVLMICDPRILSRDYGRRFLRSLPPMRPTRDLAEVEAFLAAI
jgi:ATP-dependent DNA helicase DinG